MSEARHQPAVARYAEVHASKVFQSFAEADNNLLLLYASTLWQTFAEPEVSFLLPCDSCHCSVADFC